MVARQKNSRVGQWAGHEAPFNSLADVLTESSECLIRLIDLILHISSICMLICMDTDFVFSYQKICVREVVEVFSHFHNIIGFKVTMTVLHVCAFAVVSLYTCTWLPMWWNKVVQPFQSWMPEGMLTQNLLKFKSSEMQLFSAQLREINRILLITIFNNLHFCIISFPGFSVNKKELLSYITYSSPKLPYQQKLP